MFDFFNKKKSRRTSRVRVWAEGQSQLKQEDQPIIKTLSNSIIYGLCSFCNPQHHKSQEEDFLNEARKRLPLDYSGDAPLFEVGCYLYFRIDLWHVQKGIKEEYRDGVFYKYLIRKFLAIFQDALNLKNSSEILQNRLNLYGKLAREEKAGLGKMHYYLSQLVSRTKNNTLPKIHDFDDFPLLLNDIVEEMFLKVEIASFEQGIIPACLNNLKIFYESMTPELKQFLLDSVKTTYNKT